MTTLAISRAVTWPSCPLTGCGALLSSSFNGFWSVKGSKRSSDTTWRCSRLDLGVKDRFEPLADVAL